jgi:hypothetical protein
MDDLSSLARHWEIELYFFVENLGAFLGILSLLGSNS